MIDDINNLFGDMDLYLMDQLLKGAFPGGSVLDIGFGQGRNLVFFIQQGLTTYGIEKDSNAVTLLEYFLKSLKIANPPSLLHGDAMALPYEDDKFDLVISTRTFHFLENLSAFWKAWQEIRRTLKPGGLLYFSMNSLIGIPSDELPEAKQNGIFRFEDGSEELLLTPEILKEIALMDCYEPVELAKTVHIEGVRSESILVLRKR